jgi:hypothetical protein
MKWIDVQYGGVSFLMGSYRQAPEKPVRRSPQSSSNSTPGRPNDCSLEIAPVQGDNANRAG